ncbi:MAG: hypothetical protein M1839_003472 [Geoglossum umbratile]|nr:MAG: hypothetical protein M1839_003472 [Geoglossum umbratile]
MVSLATAEERGTSKIHTAGVIIIGDEVLNGKVWVHLNHEASKVDILLKIIDTNSAFFARWCFSLGISLKRIEVISDDGSEIMEASKRMSESYDLVVTSGGIGPTHDDVTYPSIAKAFGLELKFHEETFTRMKKLSKPHYSQPNFSWETPSPMLTARLRMVHLPIDKTRDEKSQLLYVSDDLWVPIVIVNGNVHILPGIPRLFEKLLDCLKPILLPRLTDRDGKGMHMVLFSTPLAESAVATYLTELATRLKPRGIKVGSYPRWGKKKNTVTLVGKDREYMESLVAEVEKCVQGRRVNVEGEDDSDEGEDSAS